MAIAFRSAGTVKVADVNATGTPQAFSLPAGHVSGDLLILVCVQDCQTHETGPSGWTFLGRSDGGTQTLTAFYNDMSVYWRIDNGSLGSSVNVGFSTSHYPSGVPYVIGCVLAYSGAHQTNPIQEFSFAPTTDPAALQAHPQLTTGAANSWLLTIRSTAASGGRSFTCSVGGDSERVDSTDSPLNEQSLAIYDSGALSAGLQTQRSTTASSTNDWGSGIISLAVRPPDSATAVTALAGVASASGTAFDLGSASTQPGWDACAIGMPVYTTAIDWAGNGSFADSGDDVTPDDLDSGISIAYGRDQNRQLSPGAVGTMGFSLNNTTRKYSPENVLSPLYGTLDPARPAMAQAVFAGQTFPLFTGVIDDYSIHVERANRSVDFTFLDGLALLQGVKLSTPLYQGMRTGDLVGIILDEVGWTAARDLDVGATIVPYWWVEGVDALTALQDLVLSEGPPAIAYVAPDGTFVYRDRHHRLLRQTSAISQGVFAAGFMMDCASPAPTGTLHFTDPLTYEHGWRDIINSVSFDVDERSPDAVLTAVWTTEDTFVLGSGQSTAISVSGNDPFVGAVVPVSGTDFTYTGAGVPSVSLSRDSGASTGIFITAVGGSVVITGMQLRAQAVPVRRTRKVSLDDPHSIDQHGEKSYPNAAPWAGANDAEAIATLVLAHYAQRKPIVLLTITSSDPAHWLQVATRTVSDRITIRSDELGLNTDFYIEHVEHTISRMNSGRPPVHSIVLGCEKALEDFPANPFTFDAKGAGFDQGVFNPSSSDNPNFVFIWDHPTQGQFDRGQFGT